MLERLAIARNNDFAFNTNQSPFFFGTYSDTPHLFRLHDEEIDLIKTLVLQIDKILGLESIDMAHIRTIAQDDQQFVTFAGNFFREEPKTAEKATNTSELCQRHMTIYEGPKMFTGKYTTRTWASRKPP